MDELSEFSFVWSKKKKLLGYRVVVENVVGSRIGSGIWSGIWSGIGSGMGSRGSRSGSGSGSKRFPNPERARRMAQWWRRMGLRRMRKD